MASFAQVGRYVDRRGEPRDAPPLAHGRESDLVVADLAELAIPPRPAPYRARSAIA